MLKNYLTVGLRNVVKNPLYSAINIGGLAVGMAITILIVVWVYDELSFDSYHSNYDRLAQVMQQSTANGETLTGPGVPRPLEHVLRDEYSNDFESVAMSSWTAEYSLGVGERRFTKLGSFVQAELPSMLSLEMTEGVIDCLRDQSSIILSESTARALFGDASPLNETVQINGRMDAKVTGVYQDLPSNTTFASQQFFCTWSLYAASNDWVKDAVGQWRNNSFRCFVLLSSDSELSKINDKIRKVKAVNDPSQASFSPEIFLHSMSNWHLRSDWKNGKNIGGKIQLVWLFATIGSFVLFLACINFMNLSTARSEKRAKEVGIRRTIGSMKKQLIAQFLGESLLIVIVSFCLALLLVALSWPFFNDLAGKSMVINWANPQLWLSCLFFIVVTTLLAGSYPAFYLSSFHPVTILKGTFKTGASASLPRRVLVVIQFSISISLIIGTIIVYNQVQFTKNRPLGYSQDGLIMLQMKSPAFFRNAGTSGNMMYDILSNEVKRTGSILEFAECSSPLTAIWQNGDGFSWEGKDPDQNGAFNILWTSHDYGRAIQWEIIEGRDFDRSFATDSSAVLLNEAAVQFMGVNEPIGMTIDRGSTKMHVIGVVNDMVMSSPYMPVRPAIYIIGYENVSWIIMKLNPEQNTVQSIEQIESVFKKVVPSAPFDYSFVNESYAMKFTAEERIGKLSGVFSCLAIILSCLGLFGLTSFLTEQRAKEIGIRRLLGASILSLWKMLSKDFLILVGLSCIVSLPIASYLMQDWLSQYQYRAEISGWVLASTCTGAFLIAIATVSFQALKVSRMNPVDSLKME